MEETFDEKLYLCFINLVGEENDGYYRYEFIFTDNPDECWGEDYEYKPAGLVNGLYPNDEYITEIHTIKMKVKLDLIQDNSCFGFQDAMDGIVALAYENIDNYDEYPDDRIILFYGDEYDDVERKLALRNILIMQ